MKFIYPVIAATAPLLTAFAMNSCEKEKSGPQTKQAEPTEEKVEEKVVELTPKQQYEKNQLLTSQKALKIIENWRGSEPQKGARSLKIVYWSPNDREPQLGYKKRLNDILLDIQKYYAKEMDRNGFGKLSLKLDKGDDGLVEILQVKGTKPYSAYAVNSGGEVLKDTKKELKKQGIDADKETVVIFCNMSNWDADRKTINQNSPYYARGNSNHGVAWQVDSAILNLADLTNMKDRVRDGQYGDITRGKYNTIFIGGIAHELGHAFGLPHNKQRNDESILGIALMGSGNRAYGNELRKDGPPAFITQAHALKLSTHPMFSGVTKEMLKEVTFNYKNGFEYAVAEEQVMVKGTIEASIPCYAVVAYLDPDGGGDYDATTHVAIPNADGSFMVNIPSKAFSQRQTKGDIRFVSYFVNGKATANQSPIGRDKIPYFIDNNGQLILGRKK